MRDDDPGSGRPPWHFFALTFALSWGAWLPSWLLGVGGLPPDAAFRGFAAAGRWLGGLGPTLAALILVAVDGGRPGVARLLRRVLQIGIGRWYLPALLLVPGVVVVAHLLHVAAGGELPPREIHATPWMIVPLFLVLLVMQVGEEYGWRGYALDGLQRRWSALGASLAVGIAWAAWHLPLFLVAGFQQHDHGVPFGHFAITLVAVSVLITWMQNGAHGSLVPAFVCHAEINLAGEVLPLWSPQAGVTTWTIANGLLIACALVIWRTAWVRQPPPRVTPLG